jgi:hypothetical protein
MSDTARDYQTIESASTEGMDALFDGSVPGSVLEEPGTEPCSTSAVEVVSTDEAARRLGISTRAVIKRLKTGALKGFREDSKPRAEWRIYWTEPGSEPGRTGSFEGTSKGTSEPVDSDKANLEGQESEVGSSYLVELNTRLLEQIQALTYRNGYLESQLSEREKDIIERDEKMKLLTDSQHKGGWWARFSSWFFGRG